MIRSHGYAAQSATTSLAPFQFERRDPGPRDVQIEIQFCGICHTDIHFARNEWGFSKYPMVPGHEIVGKVTKVGNAVKKFKVGDLAGVGCMVGSCGTCRSCKEGEEQYCDNGKTIFTYNGDENGANTFGGYSNNIVTDEAFVLKISAKLNLAATAPLLCAGITTYSPMKYHNVSKGQRVGVIGLGGLGHMALKFAHAFGAQVTQFTTSPGKEADAKKLGADEVVLTRDPANLTKLAGSFDFLIDTVAAQHDVAMYLNLLKRDGTLTLVGAPPEPLAVPAMPLLFKRANLSGSLIGGIKQTQEMLDYCADKNIVSDIEIIPMQKVNEAFERILKNDVKYRFVIDMASLKN